MELIPKSDSGKIQVSVELSLGSSLDTTTSVLAEMHQTMGFIVIGRILSSTVLPFCCIPASEYLVSHRSRLGGRDK